MRRKKSNKNVIFTLIFFILFLIIGLCYLVYNISKDPIVKTESNPSTNEKNVETMLPSQANNESEPTANSKTVTSQDNEYSSVLVSCVGDCTIGTDDKFNKSSTLPAIVQAKNNDMSYLFKNVLSIFNSDDITTANLETTFTNSNAKRNKGGTVSYNFKASPEFAKSLNDGSIEAVNISNNHIYDYNQQGFNDTIDTLKNNNINYFGEGNKWITTINNVKFGFLGYQGWSSDDSFLQKIKNDIAALKAENCIVIINFHWGEENKYTPNETQKKLAHYSIDNGADLIIGHHPHVIEGIEKYKNRIICYSMGNFCFGGNSNPSDKDSFILQSKFNFTNKEFTQLEVKIIPCSISSTNSFNDYCPTPMKDDKKINFINKLNSLSLNLDFKLDDNFNSINIENK